MTTKPYNPEPDSFAARVLAFFRANPDEELSAKDLGIKFDVAPSSVRSLLVPALAHGLLMHGRSEEGALMVFRAGPELQPPAAEPAAPANPPPRRDRKSPRPPADLPPPQTLQVVSGKPLPRVQGGRCATPCPYTPVFERMEVGDSFLCASSASKSLIDKAVRFGKPRGRKFAVRAIDTNTAGIWRTA